MAKIIKNFKKGKWVWRIIKYPELDDKYIKLTDIKELKKIVTNKNCIVC